MYIASRPGGGAAERAAATSTGKSPYDRQIIYKLILYDHLVIGTYRII